MDALRFAIGLALIAVGVFGLVRTSRRHVHAHTDSRDVVRWVASIGCTVIGLWLFGRGLVAFIGSRVHGS